MVLFFIFRSPKLQHTVVTKAISLKRPKPIRPKSSKSSYEAYDEQAIPAQRLYVFSVYTPITCITISLIIEIKFIVRIYMGFLIFQLSNAK